MNPLRIRIRIPDDFHVHFRRGENMPAYVRRSAMWAERVLVMPNTVPAVRYATDALCYKDEILSAVEDENVWKNFTPLMTCKLYPDHSTVQIREMKKADIIACKLYPHGVTTHAEDGVSDALSLKNVYCEMEAQEMVLCIHGERPDSFVLDREKNFLKILAQIQKVAPRLRIVLEHVSCKEAVEYVQADTSGLLAATVTVHHALFSLQEMMGDFLNPHLFCKPVLKSPEDMRAIQNALLEENEKFFLGTDSAPHSPENKECACACAGVYSAPLALPLITEFFYKARDHFASYNGWVRALEKFTSLYGAHFYKLATNTKTLTLVREPWTIPLLVDGVVPLCAGETVQWKVE